MRTNLALLNIVTNPQKTLLSLAGIGIAVLLIFMQLGFLGAVEETATNTYDQLDFDVLICSRNYLHFVDCGTISEAHLFEIEGSEGVKSTNWIDVSVVSWRIENTGLKSILLMGVDPIRPPFKGQELNGAALRLNRPDSLVADIKSHSEFEPANGHRFSGADIGRQVYLNDRPLEITGLFELGAGLVANGAAMVNKRTFQRLVPTVKENEVSLGLIKLESDVNPQAFALSMRQRFTRPDSDAKDRLVDVWTKEQIKQRERERWVGDTPIGFIFKLGVLVAWIVGSAIVYMVLSNDVSSRLNEYATMKAMGYSNGYMVNTILKQAGLLAMFSFIPAMLLAMLLYWITGALANIALVMTVSRIIMVLLLTFLMCGLAGTLALKKLWQAEPAELF